ncbi:MAG TPA: 30S ribosomal protein S3 [Caldisericia bacterium]|nr:30S ribosomal protein S3 [Caldisericia bacterium]
MGQKTHPFGYRLGVVYDWNAHWFSKQPIYQKNLIEDLRIRNTIDNLGADIAVSKTEIDRKGNEVRVRIHTARPGILIGRHGSNVEVLRKKLEKVIDGNMLKLEVVEVGSPDLNAKLVAESVAQQIEKRIPYKRAMKQAIFRVMKNGAIGVKIMCSGRLNGAEIARTEWFREGRLPLHSIRAKIDYCCTTAHTKFGCIGIKVWIYTGDVSTDSAGLPALLSISGG